MAKLTDEQKVRGLRVANQLLRHEWLEPVLDGVATPLDDLPLLVERDIVNWVREQLLSLARSIESQD